MSFYIGCGMVLVQDDKYVLVQESRGEARRGLYNLPGGTLEVDEDIMACIQREVREETGVTVEPDFLIGVSQLVLADGHNVLFFVFSGRVPGTAIFQSDEHEVIKAFTYNEVNELDQQGLLRAPSVLQAVQDYRAGIRYPLDLLRAYHLPSVGAVTVEKK